MKDYKTFGAVIEALKEGKTVTKENWHEYEFLWLKAATRIKAEWCKDEKLKALVEQQGGEINACNTICKYLFTNKKEYQVLTGWTPSQKEMFDEDWIVLD